MTKIKICGLRRMEDIQAANRFRPDYVGFVFAPKSQRYVTREQAKGLREALAPEIPAVGVFVDAEISGVVDLVQNGIIDMIQLHGKETEAYIERLRQSLGEHPCSILQAFTIREEEDLQRAMRSSADWVLLDNGKGTGHTFDWNLLTGMGFDRPFFLAGGLDADNMKDAIARCHPYAVDLSSGVETNGVKDPVKMGTCIERVRNER